MKRDMSLVREILRQLEEDHAPMKPMELSIEGYTPEQISYHAQIMEQAGLVTAKDFSSSGHFDIRPVNLTWAGHEFLDAARDENRWKQARARVQRYAGTATFQVWKELLTQIAKNQLELG